MSESATCSFDKKFNIKDVKSKKAIKIHNDHAYAIVGIDETKKYVRMINPWKSGGRLKRNSPKSNEGGHIAMSYNAFKRHLEDIDYTIKR